MFEQHFITELLVKGIFLYKESIGILAIQNPTVYKTYFDDILPTSSGSKDLFVSEDINIYSTLNTMRDVTPLNNIVTNKLYEAHFKIVSNCNQKIRIVAAQKVSKDSLLFLLIFSRRKFIGCTIYGRG